MDLITRFSNGQVITTDVVSDVVNSFGSDAAREIFIREPHLIKFMPTVIAAGMASGIRVEFRVATNAALTGSPLVIGDSGVILPAQLEVVGINALHQFRTRPIALPSGYDFWGIYYNVVNSALSGGFALRTWLADEGPESAEPPM